MHPQFSSLRVLAEAIAKQSNSQFGYLTDGCNAAGAWLAGAVPHRGAGGSTKDVIVGKNVAELSAEKLAACLLLNIEPDTDWSVVANNIKIHKFPDGTTMEHSKYDGDIIKQADANLLSYPLNIVKGDELLKDLKYYEEKLAVEGPAMGKSIFAVIYARLGNAEKAFSLFKESYEPNKRPPFGALSEAATSNNPYFVTGAGGMLQTILFGFGGLHLTEEGIIQVTPMLPKGWKSLTLKGIGAEKKTFVIN